jgi:flagellar basal-body rod protein FlgB
VPEPSRADFQGDISAIQAGSFRFERILAWGLLQSLQRIVQANGSIQVSDKVFGIHAQALNLRAQRTSVLAANLANTDTPNYKARDIDFASALSAEARRGEVTLQRTNSGHAGSGGVGGFDDVTLKYRIPSQPSLDGNTVDEQAEKSEFASNAVRYMASISFMDKRVSGLIRALREE